MYDDVIRKMTLEDKIALCSGKDFWHTKDMEQYGIPSMMMCDGPHGLRKQEDAADMLGVNASVPATCFPPAVLTACSWDEELLQEIGKALGEEALENEVGVVLGPGANIKRNPLCGRNFEYFSEDPYLTGKLAAAHIRGVESTGAGSSLKHFALNNQEYKRFSSDSIVDERAMREIYLAGFETAVKEGCPSTVMCAYNKINGIHCSDSRLLLNEILRGEWGFDGMVVTDWGAMSDRIKGFRAGCDLSMPGGSDYMEEECRKAVETGELSEEEIDRCAERILRLLEKSRKALESWEESEPHKKSESRKELWNTSESRKELESPKEPGQENDKAASYRAVMEGHYELARRAAAESAVLLKNEDGVLPLHKGRKTVFIGHMARKLRYQGSGSSHINPWKLTSATESCPDAVFAEGCDRQGDTTQEMLAQVREAAGKAEQVVVFAGLTEKEESEGFDRENMKMPEGHIRMIETAVSANPNVAVVLLCGSVVELPWADKVKAILYMGLPGEAGGDAIADLLYGRENPCGKLAESWPLRYEDCISAGYYGSPHRDAQYRESIYVGYRYYETAQVPVRYPFGYGLSYTTFSYQNMQVNREEGKIRVSCEVTNTGKTAGREIVQLYIEAIDSPVYRPKRELRAFAKVDLQPGETKTVVFLPDDRSFAIWQAGWKIPAGRYRLCVGADCRDIRFMQEVEIQGENMRETAVPSWYRTLKGAPGQAEFEQLIGRKIPEPVLKKGAFTMENTVMEMKDHAWIMKIMFKAVERTVAKGFGGITDYNNPKFRMMICSSVDCSLSGMKINGAMKNRVLEGMLEMANGHILHGLRLMIKRAKKIKSVR